LGLARRSIADSVLEMDDVGGVSELGERLRQRLARIYGELQAAPLSARLLERLRPACCPPRRPLSERDVLLITYGDSITTHAERPLRTLQRFLHERLAGVISTVHVLPFYPSSSDGGFAVSDYRKVHPMLGGWEDIEALGQDFDLMFDLVLNHVSSRSAWFTQFLGNRAPGKDYFLVVDPDSDLAQVVRPRSHPLLAEYDTEVGPRHVWATFSADQLDLNFGNPDVLLEMLEVFQHYLQRGARLVRLDAVAFLWKRLGTGCIHLPETHEVVKLMREVADAVAPGSMVLTETNVPHAENIAYFGDGDEAHMVYQFSLPPLLLHALHTGDARHLTRWAELLEPPPPGCTYLNFTASHDGIGLRPAEGLLPQLEIDALVAGMQRAGGYASSRDLGGGRRAVYELNITYFDALRGTAERREDGLQVPRFVCSQLIALSLQGVPALYIQSIVATVNDHERVDTEGQLRSVNRSKWALDHVRALLDDPRSAQHRVYHALHHALSVRRSHRAFHPEASQRFFHLSDGVFAFERRCIRRAEPLLVLANVTSEPLAVKLPEPYRQLALRDALSGLMVAAQPHYELERYQVVWLTRAA